jgi:ABC-2 type transport system ATP-binding protein
MANAGIADRASDRVETLSGGLRRRVELAKATLHEPSILLLDEPSTGLDPGARVDLWDGLRRLRASTGVTVVFTSHLLEEAERADRLALLHEGRLVALDTPDALRATLGGDSVELRCRDAAAMAQQLLDAFQLNVRIIDGGVRFEAATGGMWVGRILERFPAEVRSITVGKPTLEDVFLARTGHRLAPEGGGP